MVRGGAERVMRARQCLTILHYSPRFVVPCAGHIAMRVVIWCPFGA